MEEQEALQGRVDRVRSTGGSCFPTVTISELLTTNLPSLQFEQLLPGGKIEK